MEPWHGRHGYTNHACRCDACCEAQREIRAEYWRNRTPAQREARIRQLRAWRARRKGTG